MKANSKSVDKLLIGISFVVIISIVSCLYMVPEKSEEVAQSIFTKLTNIFGSSVLIFTFAGTVFLIFLAFSKYGKIKLGEGKPEHSTFKWVSMMLSCGLGSATVYWAFLEWAYYIETPGLGIEAFSTSAYEMAVAYNLYHYGLCAWALYALIGIPVAYHCYVRKNTGMSISGMVVSITGAKKGGVICRIVDVLFIFICFGGLSITLGVSTPMVTEVFCRIFGIPSTFAMNIAMIIIISIVYSFSSYIGISKGMAKISDWNIKLMILFTIALVVFGPAHFIVANITNSMGLMITNFVRISLFTDPIKQSGFPETWTMFYWLYWIAYAQFTGVFIAKISKGRTIRSVVANTLVSGSFGCFAFLGVAGSLSMERTLSGTIDVVSMLSRGEENSAIVEILLSLPFGKVFLLVFCISSLLFLATSLDGAAFSMATTASPNLKNDEEPSAPHKLFWCIMLSLVPLTMIMIDANLNTIKTCAIITAVPIFLVMILILVGWIKWVRDDYGTKTIGEIEAENDIQYEHNN